MSNPKTDRLNNGKSADKQASQTPMTQQPVPGQNAGQKGQQHQSGSGGKQNDRSGNAGKTA